MIESLLCAGVARELITPAVGTPVGGWGARSSHDSLGAHSELSVTALALGSATQNPAAIIVAADVVLWPAAVAERVRAEISDRSGCSPRTVQLAASHTHSSVMMDDPTIENWEHDGLCEAARALVEQATIDAAVRASRDLRPVRLQTVRRHCAVTRSRRQLAGERLLVGIAQPIEDAYLDVVALTEPDGRPVASMVVYGSHPTVLAWGSLDFSPDYVGSLRDVVEQGLGGLCLFLQGCGADRAPARSFSNQATDADLVGRAIGYAAVAAMLEDRERTLEHHFVRVVESGAPLAINEMVQRHVDAAEVRSRPGVVEMPLRERSLVTARGRVDRARRALTSGAPDASVELARALIELDICERFPEGEIAFVPVDVVDVGVMVFLFWPGELAGAYERLCQLETDRRLVLVTNANDYVNYLPAPHQFAEGGYEVDSSPFDPVAGKDFVAQVKALVARA